MSHLSVKADHIDLINTYFEGCKKNQQPYVLCRRRRTKADIEFDFITLDKSLDRIFEQREKEILDNSKQICLRHATKGSNYLMSAKVITMRGLNIESAEQAAADLYQMLSGVIAEKI